MDATDYVLGIDGGGTKTHCAIFDLNGVMKDFIEFGPTNHEGMPGGMDDLKGVIYHVFDTLLVRNNIGIGNLKYCVFGMAGVDTKHQHQTISKMITDYGIENFLLCNDSYLGIKAGSTHGAGICLINGTGFSVTGIDSKGAMLQIGGLGNLTEDRGGGTYLVDRIIGSVYNSLYKGGKQTLMKDMIFEDLGILCKEEFLEKVTTKIEIDGNDYTRKINLMVYDAANRKDAVAIEILEEVAWEYAKCIGGMLQELDFKRMDRVEVILAGSNFTKCSNPTTKSHLQAIVETEFQEYNIQLITLLEPCVIGAILWALQKLDGTVNIRDKVLKEYHNKINNFVLE